MNAEPLARAEGGIQHNAPPDLGWGVCSSASRHAGNYGLSVIQSVTMLPEGKLARDGSHSPTVKTWTPGIEPKANQKLFGLQVGRSPPSK